MDEIIHDAFDRILARDFHPRRSSFADRVVVLVVSAQGLVDNGGFAYFHGLPFDPPADPEDFERVYAAIGADACADAFREASRATAAAARSTGAISTMSSSPPATRCTGGCRPGSPSTGSSWRRSG